MPKITLRGGPLDGEVHDVPAMIEVFETRNPEGTLLGVYNRKNQMGIKSNLEAVWEDFSDADR